MSDVITKLQMVMRKSSVMGENCSRPEIQGVSTEMVFKTIEALAEIVLKTIEVLTPRIEGRVQVFIHNSRLCHKTIWSLGHYRLMPE